jgi:hypothetical protein
MVPGSRCGSEAVHAIDTVVLAPADGGLRKQTDPAIEAGKNYYQWLMFAIENGDYGAGRHSYLVLHGVSDLSYT